VDCRASAWAAWTFRSSHTDKPTAIPLWTSRFDPDVDQRNTVRAGKVHPVPIEATTQPTVEASFDDGTTWRRVPVSAGTAKIPHPRESGFVSLRATANSVTQTIIRAYRYG
jgi:hypothetical protein